MLRDLLTCAMTAHATTTQLLRILHHASNPSATSPHTWGCATALPRLSKVARLKGRLPI